MAPEKPTTESSGGAADVKISPEVDDAKRALDMASARNSNTQKPEDKDKQTGVGLEGAANVADTVSKDDGVSLLLDGVNSLVRSLPPLVKALDAVAQLHPFIAIAVGAFKVVIELEIKRRDNDKKVNLLFLEMKNMMSVLLQLQGVRANHVAKDGKTIGARLVDSVKRTADDIKECANVCDTYSKKRLLVKVLKGPMWDDMLKGFIKLFADRKAEFSFAVSIHTGMAIDRANDKLDALTTTMELILKFFERCVPPSQATLNEVVKQAGGPDAAIQNQDFLHTLIERERSFEDIPGGVAGVDYRAAGLSPYYPPIIPGPSHYPPGFIPRPSPYYPPVIPAPASIPNVAGIADSGRRRRSPGYTAFDYSHTAESQGWHRRMPSRRPYTEPQVIPPFYTPGVRPDYPGNRSAPSLSEKSQADQIGESLEEQEIVTLKQELSQAPSADIKKNLEAFERKFEIQTRELAEEMKMFVAHEGDRVISSVLAGPHERIIDPDLYEVWKDMACNFYSSCSFKSWRLTRLLKRWRGIVKARHLVLAIYDYYLQRQEERELAFEVNGGQPEKHRSVDEDDAWTLEYIDLMHVQPIIEALDLDTSGYVTIQEVNQFTISRPKGWSLLHWMAYWAVGWQACMTVYRSKILSTLDSMSSLLENILTPNRARFRGYLDGTRRLVANMVQPFKADTERLFLLPQFQDYMDENEARLQKSLETVRYEIDALDTLALVNGRRGLERNVFPLLYLLLSRHYDIMRLGRVHILHVDELTDAQGSINVIQGAFELRRNELSELFRQRRLSVSEELDYFAYGM
ncbi:hypothetical protein V8D89_003297, partial [Ganoderma adspersum]